MPIINYSLHEGLEAMDFARVHAWLTASYWTPDIARETVERAAQNSALLVSAFDSNGVQVGYLRVVSDKTRFAYVCDVIVDEAHRGRGIGRAMVNYALQHPDFASIRVWSLRTLDAHTVYAPLGFRPVTDEESLPETWMVRRTAPPTDVC